MWPFFQKSGCFISKIRSPLCCKRNGNLVIGKSKDCNSSKENNVVSACVTGRSRFAALGFANGHIFLPLTTQRSPNFSNQTTTFLEKGPDFLPPYLRFPACGGKSTSTEIGSGQTSIGRSSQVPAGVPRNRKN